VKVGTARTRKPQGLDAPAGTVRSAIAEIADLAKIDEAVLEQLVGERTTLPEVEALFRQIKKQIMERILRGERAHHLGYRPEGPKPAAQPNHRNGSSLKTVLTEDGTVDLAIPRDRAGTFAPQLIPKHERRLPRFDANVLSLCARGMTVRELQGHLEALYQVEVSPDVISTLTDEVLGAVRTGRSALSSSVIRS